MAADGGPRPLRVEGLDSLRWVLLDYGDFVVHVLLDEARAYYELERLWSDVPRIDWAAVEPGALEPPAPDQPFRSGVRAEGARTLRGLRTSAG